MDQQATRPKPRSFTEDYKRQVVDLVTSSGRTPTAVAGEVGLHPTLLCRWVRQYSAGAAKAEVPRRAVALSLKSVPVPTADQAAEIARLRRERTAPCWLTSARRTRTAAVDMAVPVCMLRCGHTGGRLVAAGLSA